MSARRGEWVICTSRWFGVSAGYLYVPLPRFGGSTLGPAARFGPTPLLSDWVVGVSLWRNPEKRFQFARRPWDA